MSRYCLDTSAYAQFKRGEADVVTLISGAKWVGVPVVVLGELRAGFLLGNRVEQNESELREFLDHPATAVLDVDEETSLLYAEIVLALRRAGTPIPTNDVWIAALAARDGATVLTYDSHFSTIARIGVRILKRREVPKRDESVGFDT